MSRRYEEVRDAGKASSPRYKMEQAQYDSRLARFTKNARRKLSGRRLLREAEDLEERDKRQCRTVPGQAKTLEDAAKDMDKQIRSAQGSQASMSLGWRIPYSGQPRILWYL